MENNQNELRDEEIPNIEQFQVGRVPSEGDDQQTGTQNIAGDDDVELGFTEEEPSGQELDAAEDVENDDDEADESTDEPGDEDADFENPGDDPA
jgi:hypothetical protein